MRSFKFALIALAVSALPAMSFANELDSPVPVSADQKALAAQLPGTVVVRVNTQDQSVAVLHSDALIPGSTASQTTVENANFVPMQTNGTQVGKSGELDRDSSTNSWFFYFNNYNWCYPTYYYGGYTYNYYNYYNFNYGYYNYYYYWYRWRW